MQSHATLRGISRAAAGIVIGAGLAVLVGWASDIALLKSMVPASVTMKPNTAVAFILGGLALWFASDPRQGDVPAFRRVVIVCSSALIAIAAVTLIEYAAGPLFGFDQVLFSDDSGARGNPTPGRMTPQTALCFLLAGVSLLARGERMSRAVESALHLPAFAFALLSIASHAFAVPPRDDLLGFPRMAVPSAIALIVLSIGLLAARGPSGVIGVVTDDGAGGRLSRRLLPIVIVTPLFVGWLRLRGQQAGFYGPEFGLAVGSVLSVVVFTALVWWGAASLESFERARREAREELSRSELRHRRLFDNAPVALFRTAPNGVFLDANPALHELFGVPTGTLVGTNAKQWYARDDDRALFEATMQRDGVIRDQPLEIRRADGTTAWVLDTTRVVRDAVTGEVTHEGGLIDVTERHLAEANRTASEQRFRALIEHSRDGIVMFGADHRILYHSPAVTTVLGVQPSDRIGHSLMDLVHPDDAHRVRSFVGRVSATPGASEVFEHRMRHSDGSWRWLESRVTNLLHDPAVNAFVTNYRDVTDRKAALEALHESGARFREMADHITEAFFVIDVALGRPVYVSPMWEKIWGRPYTGTETGRTWMETVHADDQAAVFASHERVRAGEANECVYRIMRPDDSIRWVRRRAFPVAGEDGVVRRVVGVVEDITEFRRAEEHLAHSQKMEAVGRLAGGVAHDFNNLLTVILAETNMLLAIAGGDARLSESLHEIRRAGDNAAALTRQLLSFSRKQLSEPVIFDVNEVIVDTVKMLRRLIGEDVRLEINVSPDRALIRADLAQFQQVLTNLAVNARDAMPDGGTLAIETSLVSAEADRTNGVHAPATPNRVELIIRDTGVGMAEEVRARAFEPFFTTKEWGKGTGLGLATAHGIVTQAGGTITVDSEPNVGTRFRIHWPLVTEPTKRPEPGTSAEPRPTHGTETILMVEDEDAVRRVGARMLRAQGYHVLEARDGVEALRILGEYEGNVSLFFTDVVLPGLNGHELAKRACAMRPGMRVLYTTGYSNDVIPQQRLDAKDLVLIQKPYTRASLVQKVRDVLEDEIHAVL